MAEPRNHAEPRNQAEPQGKGEPTGLSPALLAQLAFIALASIGVFSFVRAARNDHRIASCSALCVFRPTYAAQDRRVPDFELPDMAGKRVRFSSLLQRHKPIVLNFWTKTCPPCLEEMPSLADMARIVKKDGVQVVTITTDDGPDAVRDTLQARLEGRELPFAVLFDPEAEVVGAKFGTTLFPETWLVDEHGIIRLRVDGKRDWTSPLALEIIDMIGRPGGCPVEFARGLVAGPHKSICGEEP